MGIASFGTSKKVDGIVTITERKKWTTVEVDVKGLGANREYAIHIHEAGDLGEVGCGKRGSCRGACAHYNPFGKNHGGLKSRERHVGDLGNLVTDSGGRCQMVMRLPVSKLRLRGRYGVIGRSVVIHSGSDDLGLGGDVESLKTGNAGSRIACGVIGYGANSRLYF